MSIPDSGTFHTQEAERFILFFPWFLKRAIALVYCLTFQMPTRAGKWKLSPHLCGCWEFSSLSHHCPVPGSSLAYTGSFGVEFSHCNVKCKQLNCWDTCPLHALLLEKNFQWIYRHPESTFIVNLLSALLAKPRHLK